MREFIKKHPIIAILRNTSEDVLEDLANSLYKGGIRAFEISFSHTGAAEQLSRLRHLLPADAVLGAGTILTLNQARQSVENGAKFLLSPSTNVEILQYCQSNSIKLLPGVFSPTDVSIALSYGFSTLKLFPVRQFAEGYIRDLQGPFPGTEYIAVGGVSPANAKVYLESGFLGVGIGSSLVRKELLRDKKWEQISEEIRGVIKSI